MSVAIIGRAWAAAAAKAAAAARRGIDLDMAQAYQSRAGTQGLQRATRNSGNFALHMLVDHMRQMVVEPLLEHRAEHFADDFLERIYRGGGRSRCRDGLQ